MFTPEAEYLYREAIECAKESGRSYSEALKAILDGKPMEPRRHPSSVLDASITLDVEIHRLMTEEHFTDYYEGMHHVLKSPDPRHVEIVRAYVAA